MGQNSLKRIACLFLSTTLALSFAGCSSDQANDTKSVQKDEPVTLNFYWWGSPARKEITQKVLDKYHQENPNINFKTKDFPNAAAVATQLAIDTADQTPPDIVQVDYSFAFNYIQRGLFEPLNSYMDNKTLDLSDVDPQYLAPGQWQGKQYVISMGTNVLSVAYDPAFLANYGVTLENGYTFDDFYAVLKTLRDKVNIPGFYPLGNAPDIAYYLRSKGETLYNKEGTGLGYTDSSLTEYFKIIKKWTDEKLLNPDIDLSSTSVGANNPLAEGKTAFYPTSSNQVVALGKLAGRQINLLNLPAIPGGKDGNFLKPSQFLAVSAFSEHKEEAVKFINYITNNPEANDILQGERGVPVAKKIKTRLESQASPQSKEQYSLIDYVAKHSTPIDPPAPKGSTMITNALQLAKNNLVAGYITPEQAASTFRTEAEKILQQEGDSNE